MNSAIKIGLTTLGLILVSLLFSGFVLNISSETYRKIWWLALFISILFYGFLIRIIWKKEQSKESRNTHIAYSLMFMPYSIYNIWTKL